MKQLRNIMLLLFSIMVMASCSGSKPAMTENADHFTSIRETVHDTVFKTEKDSSSYKALLECQNGKVIIKEVTTSEPGRNLKRPRVRIVGNQLKVDCEARAQELLAHYINTHEVNDTVIKVPVEVNKLTWTQQLEIYGFRLLLLLTLILAGWLFIKSKR